MLPVQTQLWNEEFTEIYRIPHLTANLVICIKLLEKYLEKL